MKKSFLFGALALMLAGFGFGGISMAAVNVDYIHDESSWKDSFENGGLKIYYEWSDRVNKPYKEDLWNTVANRAANINDARKENDEYVLDENGNYIYDNCERNWSGAVNAPGAKYPWVVLYLTEPFTGDIRFTYENTTNSVLDYFYNITNGIKGFGSKWFAAESVVTLYGDQYLLNEQGESSFVFSDFSTTLVPARSLTIHYKYSNGDEAAEDYTGEFLDGADYSVDSPEIANYTADVTTVSGTIADDKVVTVTYTANDDENQSSGGGGGGSSSAVKIMTVTAKKLATAPDDVNREKSQANQDAVTIEQTTDSIIIRGKLDELNSFESTNAGQQDAEHKWIGIDLGTNLTTISGATWGGSYTMTEDDVAEASSVGLGAGHIIFWTKADVINENPATITIGADGYESVTYTVKFEEKTEEKSTGSSGGGGGGSSKTTTTDDTKATTGDTAKVDENNTEENNEEKANDENKDEEKAPMTDAQAVEKFGQEQIDAYKWALENGITTMKTVEAARLDQPLTRAELAKMMVVYIQKVLEKDPIVTGDVSYSDVDESLGDLYGYIKLAYQYQIMGINADGTPIKFFNPNGLVTRGEYATVFSRVLFGDKFNKAGEDFYTKHLEALKAAGILTNTIPTIQEMRGWVMLMMYRSSQNAEKIENVANTTETNEEEKADEETATASDETKSEANEEEKAEEATNTEATTGDVAETPATQESSETTAENTETTAEATTGDVAEAPTAEASTGDTASN